jgi:glycosyltransferase involved in cell wall biosynthesis
MIDQLNMRILFLSRWFPVPINNGSKLRIYNLLRGLSKHHDITLLSFTDQPEEILGYSEMRSLCSEVHVVRWQEFNPKSRKSVTGFLSPTPRFLLDTHSVQMEDLIQNSLSSKKYELIIASELSMAAYYESFKDIPALFDDIELGGFYGGSAAKTDFVFSRFRRALTWFKLRTYLSRLMNSFSGGVVVSEQERHFFTVNFPKYEKRINVIPNCIAYRDYQDIDAQPVPNQLIFTGSFRFNANYEAIKWFVQEIFPKILAQLPETKLVVTGDHAGLPIPSTKNVILTGYVDDIKSLIASSRISIAPLLTGGGTRLKILEAMAIGIPVVTTSKGAEGLAAVSGVHLLIADSSSEFADAVVAVLKDDHLSETLSVNGKNFAKEKYDWQSVMPRFLQYVENISGNKTLF